MILHPTLTSTPDREEELVLARANAITNQCYVLNINGSLEVGGGRSIGVDPEGRVLFEGGTGEEYFSEVLDLDRVTTVRERGTRGMNRLLWQLDAHGPFVGATPLPDPRPGPGAASTPRRRTEGAQTTDQHHGPRHDPDPLRRCHPLGLQPCGCRTRSARRPR